MNNVLSVKQQEVVGITLGIDSNKITCHVKRLGGGFGGKVMKIATLSAITATAAFKYGKMSRITHKFHLSIYASIHT